MQNQSSDNQNQTNLDKTKAKLGWVALISACLIGAGFCGVLGGILLGLDHPYWAMAFVGVAFAYVRSAIVSYAIYRQL